MGDLISRKALIYAMSKWDWQELYLPVHFIGLLEDLPSVDPEEELISRKEAISMVLKRTGYKSEEEAERDTGNDESLGVLAALEAIKDTPAVCVKYEEGGNEADR